MRHGETLFNVQKRTQGWSDSPLTEKGIADAKAASQFMREFCQKNDLVFDHFYSSTQERASDTLELVFPDQPYQRLKGLKELNFGQFEAHPQYLEVWDKTQFFKQFGGETLEEVSERMLATFMQIMQDSAVQNAFCVGHGASMWFTLIKLLGRRPDELGFIDNLGMLHFTYDETTGQLEFKEKIKTI